MVPTTLKYRKAGVRPPVFVAGSFSDPEWVPREMEWALDERGESLFTKDIDIEEDRDYQYKFKVGHGNDWDLDEQSPTTSDNMGNMNNLLTIASSSRLEGFPQQSTADRPPSLQNTPSKPAEPCVLVNTHESGEKKTKHNDKLELSLSKDAPRVVTPVEEAEETAMPLTPLFSHESLGAYDFDVVDDGFDHSLCPSANRSMSISSFGAFAPDHMPDNTDDPTLERFPCDKSSVMTTLRRISISRDECTIQIEDRQLSPRIVSRRASIDSSTDSVPSPGSLSPTSSRKRDGRLSHGSTGRSKSAVPLGLIVEEPLREASKASSRGNTSDEMDEAIGLTSDEDGPQPGQSKAHITQYGNVSRKVQHPSVSFSLKTPESITSESKIPTKKGFWQADGHSPIEGRWYITGSVVLLAMGFVWWKSSRA